MPTVPRVERQIQERPASTPNLPFGDTPEISGIGQPEKTNFNMEGVNKVVDALIQKEIERVDEAVGLDNDLKMSITADSIEEDVKLRYKGSNAGQALDESRKNFADASEKIRKDSVKTRGQEDRFNRSLARNTLKLETNIGSHVSREHDSYVETSYNAYKLQAIDEVGKNGELLEPTIKELEERAKRHGELNGKPEEWIQLEIKSNTSAMVLGTIKQQQSNDDHEGALKTYNEYKSQILEKDRIGLAEELKKEADKKKGRTIAEEIFSMPPDKRYDEAKKRAGGNDVVLNSTLNEIKRTEDEIKKAKDLNENNAWDMLDLTESDFRSRGYTVIHEEMIPIKIRQAAQGTNPNKYLDRQRRWQNDMTSAKTQRELKLAQDGRYRDILGEQRNWHTNYQDNESWNRFVISEIASGGISRGQGNHLRGAYNKVGGVNSEAAQNARKRLKDVKDGRLKMTSDVAERNKIIAEHQNIEDMLDGLLINYQNKIGEKEFKEKIDNFIETVINPEEINWLGDALSWGTPYKDIGKKEELERLAGPPIISKDKKEFKAEKKITIPKDAVKLEGKFVKGKQAYKLPDGRIWVED